MTHAAPLSDSCLGRLGLHIPEPADRIFVQRVRAAVRDADLGARQLMSTIANEIPKVWCPKCREETIPHDPKGTCLFCDMQLVDADGKELHTKTEPTAERDALERMDAGQPQNPTPIQAAPAARPAAPKPVVSATGETYTRQSLLQEIRDYIAEHGSPPGSALSPGNRLWRASRKLGLVYGDLCKEALGGQAPAKKTPPRVPAGQKKTPAKPKPAATPEPTPIPGGASSTLAELASDYETACAAVAEAQDHQAQARARLTEHPLFMELAAA